MPAAWTYRGREISAEEISFIRWLISEHPGASRRALSAKLCEAWQWKQANGAPRDMVCRGLLLMLHRAGQIVLPPVRFTPPNPLARRERPAPVLIDTTPIRGPLSQLRPFGFQQVRRTADEPLFNSLIEHHHYLSYEQPVGEHLKYLVWAQGRPIACLAWSSAPRHLGSRDRFIGWSGEARQRNIRFLAYNTRFLILPWVQVPHLASHLLSGIAHRLSQDWVRLYGHPIYFLETFIDPERFRGTCYRAANWVLLGRTTGRGKDSTSKRPNRSIKEVLGYPLTRRFRQLLREASMKPAFERLDVSTEELEALLEQAREALGEAGYQKLKAAVRTLGYVTELLENREATLAALRRLLCRASTEKTEAVLKAAGIDVSETPRKPAIERVAAGHGRNGVEAYRGARRVEVPHRSLKHGDRCPECQRGKVYPQRDPGVLVRLKGQAPIEATVYELQKLRCNLCGEVFTAEAPEGVGDAKYDETSASMMALLKYGSGVPFHRLRSWRAT